MTTKATLYPSEKRELFTFAQITKRSGIYKVDVQSHSGDRFIKQEILPLFAMNDSGEIYVPDSTCWGSDLFIKVKERVTVEFDNSVE